jgi:hypothetical protein
VNVVRFIYASSVNSGGGCRLGAKQEIAVQIPIDDIRLLFLFGGGNLRLYIDR